jgi:Fe-S-cluster containining protein
VLEPGYEALRRAVDRTIETIVERRAAELACTRGCAACCHVQLSLAPVEAERLRGALSRLGRAARERVRARAVRLRGMGAAAEREPCAMLEGDGSCVIYADRPLVCRTQGHALRYPAGTLPENAARAHVPGGEITWCPLNYVAGKPASEDVLDAERVDDALARANLAFAGGDRALTRTRIADIALE